MSSPRYVSESFLEMLDALPVANVSRASNPAVFVIMVLAATLDLFKLKKYSGTIS